MKKLIVMLICSLSTLLLPMHVHAQGITELPSLVIEQFGNGENVGEQYNSIMQVVVSFTDGDNNKVPLQGGCGFLIGNDNNQLQYMITTNEVVTVSDTVKDINRRRQASFAVRAPLLHGIFMALKHGFFSVEVSPRVEHTRDHRGYSLHIMLAVDVYRSDNALEKVLHDRRLVLYTELCIALAHAEKFLQAKLAHAVR